MLLGFPIQRWLMCVLLTVLPFPSYSFELVLAKASTDSQKAVEELAPMADYMAGILADKGVTGSSVRLFDSSTQLIEELKAGRVHWVTDTGLVASKLLHAGAEPIAVKWKKGKGRYRSIIFTRNDSELKSIDHLLGKTIAFEDESSFSSYFLPRYMIEREGLDLQYLENLNQEADPSSVNYVFARTEKNIALWVEKGLVDAGVLNTSDWNSARRLLPEVKRRMHSLVISEAFPRAFELVSPSLPVSVKRKLTEHLMQMNMDDHGLVLKAYEKTSRFEPITLQHIQQLQSFFEESKEW